MTRLTFLDELASEGRLVFTAQELREQFGLSPQAASNLVKRWRDAGLIDVVRRGVYALRPFGRMGTRVASEDVALAVAATFRDKQHRIAYLSALDYHGLLDHPARAIQVASPHRLRASTISGRRLELIYEPSSTVLLGSVRTPNDAYVSTPDRALIDTAARLDLVGGAEVLIEVMRSYQFDQQAVQELAEELNASASVRRIGSVARQLQISPLTKLKPLSAPLGDIPLDPSLAADRKYRDSIWRVVWYSHPDTYMH